MPYFVRLPLCYFVMILIFKPPCINYDLFCFPKERLSEVIECGGFGLVFFFYDEYFKSVLFPSEENSAPPASIFSSIQKNKHREELK